MTLEIVVNGKQCALSPEVLDVLSKRIEDSGASSSPEVAIAHLLYTAVFPSRAEAQIGSPPEIPSQADVSAGASLLTNLKTKGALGIWKEGEIDAEDLKEQVWRGTDR